MKFFMSSVSCPNYVKMLHVVDLPGLTVYNELKSLHGKLHTKFMRSVGSAENCPAPSCPGI